MLLASAMSFTGIRPFSLPHPCCSVWNSISLICLSVYADRDCMQKLKPLTFPLYYVHICPPLTSVSTSGSCSPKVPLSPQTHPTSTDQSRGLTEEKPPGQSVNKEKELRFKSRPRGLTRLHSNSDSASDPSIFVLRSLLLTITTTTSILISDFGSYFSVKSYIIRKSPTLCCLSNFFNLKPTSAGSHSTRSRE
jgi:hypothetical protein